jgi:XTP/dITP diphosphohydrolase
MTIFVATSNQGKMQELLLAAKQAGLGDLVIAPLPGLAAIPPPKEDGSTFEENAVSKALYYSRFTTEYVLADDSGLEVDALDNAPGLHSARYAGPQAKDSDNNRLLLENLGEASSRAARFVCVIALARQGQLHLITRGTADGEILTEPKGTQGFGYDPLFFCPALGRSFGEINGVEKFGVSHRGNAIRSLFESIAGRKHSLGSIS